MDKIWIPTFTFLLIGLDFAASASSSKANLTTLRVAQVIFRHGARSIDETYPSDPYINESYWYPGYSQLNNLGKLQGYNLGLHLRERYGGFVKDTYDMKDVYVLSSDFARTMQTAYSVMAGFYLPNDLNITEDFKMDGHVEIPLPWKSVPNHTTPEEHDNIIYQNAKFCPRFAQLLKQVQTELVDQYSDEEKRLFKSISNNTGIQITDKINYNARLDSISIEHYYNFTLPNWTAPLLNSSLTTESVFLLSTKTFEMKRLRVGPVLEKLIKNMLMNETVFENEFHRSRSGQKKIYFFSGHDSTIAGVLNTLGLFDAVRPVFTSALLVELHEDAYSQELYVEFYYRNETDRDPYKLEVADCPHPCFLSKFRELAEPYIPSDWSKECQLPESSGSISGAWIALIIIAIWILMFIALQFWMRSGRKCFWERKPRRDSYTHFK